MLYMIIHVHSDSPTQSLKLSQVKFFKLKWPNIWHDEMIEEEGLGAPKTGL